MTTIIFLCMFFIYFHPSTTIGKSPVQYFFVGVPGIEPEPHTPEACILPLYYTPMWTIADSNRLPHPCHGCALPDELMAQIYSINRTAYLYHNSIYLTTKI